ncbi:hypothetical protein CLOSTHATH_01514 [Hungatella hathewayi DSM 13479]|uniref:Uncharacterized protein n=2 Tax=Hungatella hathewayi TaxID=154046 RepID=D3AD36_9FIRM|nr:hypothetical protein CLOSTHATH_01514 [Hungatella hathewayi DSM 13479]
MVRNTVIERKERGGPAMKRGYSFFIQTQIIQSQNIIQLHTDDIIRFQPTASRLSLKLVHPDRPPMRGERTA